MLRAQEVRRLEVRDDAAARSTARAVVTRPGERLEAGTARRLGVDLYSARVRVHTDVDAARSASKLGAAAYTVGNHIVFGQSRYAPGTPAGDRLLAHEIAHVIQDRAVEPQGSLSLASPTAPREREADRAAAGRHDGPGSGGRARAGSATAGTTIHRRIEPRDVGRGEQSGFARLPDLIARLTAMSTSLTYALDGAAITYVLRDGGTTTEFDRLMMRVIDLPAVVPLRLTNRHGLLGSHAAGFNFQTLFDSFVSGYVDIDDLLSSTDLGLQVALAHVLTERSTTRDYARRIGTPGLGASFTGGHRRGIATEVAILRDFFGDPSIRNLAEPAHAAGAVGPGTNVVVRWYRNDRRDTIFWRIDRGSGSRSGIDASTIRVRTHDRRNLSAEEYRAELHAEGVRAQVERERLGGADEHREGGQGVPAP